MWAAPVPAPGPWGPPPCGRSTAGGLDDGGARDEVVEGSPLVLVHDAEEADAQGEEQGDTETDCAEDGLPPVDRPTPRGDHLQPEDGHAERLSAHRPLVREVEELPRR